MKTDAQGRFTTSREPDPDGQYFTVVVVHPDLYAEVPRAAFEASSTITAKPWGRIEGTVSVEGKPAARASIRAYSDRLGNPDVPAVSYGSQTATDDRGRFVLERVVPGDVRLGSARTCGDLVEVRSGETAHAVLGGRGRTVVAKVVVPEGSDPKADYLAFSEVRLQSDRPNIPYPKERFARPDTSMINWGKRWWASAEGHAYRRNWYGYGSAKLNPDGTVRFDDVPPGEYLLRVMYSAAPIQGVGALPDKLAIATKQFIIPEGRVGEPVDLGVLRPKPRRSLKVGEAVPAFDVESLDDRRLKLEDFRGKYLVLAFWATWCSPCLDDLPALKSLHERFGTNGQFAMLSLSLDAEKDAPRKLAADKGLNWPQGFLGDRVEGGVQEAYHVEAIPSVFLIGPDGKLVASGLRGETVATAVAKVLRAP